MDEVVSNKKDPYNIYLGLDDVKNDIKVKELKENL